MSCQKAGFTGQRVYAEPANAQLVRNLKGEMEYLRKQLDDRDQFAGLIEGPDDSVDRIGPDGTLNIPAK